jgi:hypothetical protein
LLSRTLPCQPNPKFLQNNRCVAVIVTIF